MTGPGPIDDTQHGPAADATTVPVRVEPLGISLAVPRGGTVFAAAEQAGLVWPTRCGGIATCGLCVMRVVDGGEHLGPPGVAERRRLERDATRTVGWDQDAMRLACSAVVNGPLRVSQDWVRRTGEAVRSAAPPPRHRAGAMPGWGRVDGARAARAPRDPRQS